MNWLANEFLLLFLFTPSFADDDLLLLVEDLTGHVLKLLFVGKHLTLNLDTQVLVILKANDLQWIVIPHRRIINCAHRLVWVGPQSKFRGSVCHLRRRYFLGSNLHSLRPLGLKEVRHGGSFTKALLCSPMLLLCSLSRALLPPMLNIVHGRSGVLAASICPSVERAAVLPLLPR